MAGSCRDASYIRKVDTFNDSYRLKEAGAVLNWFDITQVEGYLSLNSKMKDIMATLQGKLLLLGILKDKMPKNKKEGLASGFDISSMGGMMDVMGSFTLLRLTGMMGMMNISFTKEELLDMNAKLNKIKAPQK